MSVAKIFDLLEERAKRASQAREKCGCPACQGFMSPLVFPYGLLQADRDGKKLVFVRDEFGWGIFLEPEEVK